MIKISFRDTGKVLLSLMTLIIIYHVLILTGVLPQEAVWGNRINDSEKLIQMEYLAIVIMMIFISIIILKLKYKNHFKVINILLWIVFSFSVLNIIGNILSGSQLEKIIFIPVTIIQSLLLLRIGVEK
jgi:archaellum biogenesis protein FlaJ (TadC family)